MARPEPAVAAAGAPLPDLHDIRKRALEIAAAGGHNLLILSLEDPSTYVASRGEPNVTKAYSYTRFSTLEQAKRDSFRRQSEAVSQYVTRHGLEPNNDVTFMMYAFRLSRAQMPKAERSGNSLQP